jgi:hypothetical protein
VDLINDNKRLDFAQDCNLWFWSQVAIAKGRSFSDYFMHYRHGETDFARKGKYHMSVRVAAVDWLKVSLILVHDNSINYMFKLSSE